MQKTNKQISGLILAGGRGRRVNQEDKGLLLYEGISMVERQLNWFLAQGISPLISANRNLRRYREFGLAVISDKEAGFSGPLTGVLRGLEFCNTPWLYVQPVDMPFMPADTLNRLIQKITFDKPVYYLRSNEREHYLSMLISRQMIPALKNFLLEGNRRVRDFLAIANAESIAVGIEEASFANFNHLSDYSVRQ